MSDLPSHVQINEEGPREGFQFEKGAIATDRKIALIDALSQTGINHIQIVSFVNPKNVPGMADADEVVERAANLVRCGNRGQLVVLLGGAAFVGWLLARQNEGLRDITADR